MKIEERKYNVYIADDGKEFKTEEACVNYESFNLETKLREEVARTISKRDETLARINYTKANKYGLLSWVTKKIKSEEDNFNVLLKDFNNVKGAARTKWYAHISAKSMDIFKLKQKQKNLQTNLKEDRKSLNRYNELIASHTRKLQELKEKGN